MVKVFFNLFIIVFAMICSTQTFAQNDPIPKHDSLKIHSRFINEERVINVWIPPGYSETNDHFPVVYMPDGGIKEDFPHIANTLDKLIKQKLIPGVILVGIENTIRTRDLSGPTQSEYDLKLVKNYGGSENFRQFIENELFPLINKSYRTTDERIIIGESASGLFIIETFILAPGMFCKFIAIDPSLWWNNHYLIENFETLTKENNYENTKLWFAGSNAKDIQPHTRKLEKKLRKFDTKLVWKYSDEPKEKHNTIFRATKEKALTWIFKNP